VGATATSDLPIGLAVRLLLDSVSYSGALPPWFDTVTIDYAGRERRIREQIARYKTKTESPKPPFEIAVPRRGGDARTWIVPTINDQIIYQACISSFANELEQATIDRSRVFSMKLNTDPDRVAFLEDQARAWSAFRAYTHERCQADGCMLQVDIKDAFPSIHLDRMWNLARTKCGDLPIISMLEEMIAEQVSPGSGMPFLNDGFFFLGNAYLSEVDRIVRSVNSDFVRFVDDYRLFGTTRTVLEGQLTVLRSRLGDFGFDLNDTKLKLGLGSEYLEAVSTLKVASTTKTNYIDAAVQPGVLRATDIHEQIMQVLAKPDELMHQEYGRLQMAALRRMHVRGLYSDLEGYADSPATQLISLLTEDGPTVDAASRLLDQYAQDGANAWRLIWILYMLKSVDLARVPDMPSASTSQKRWTE
jgi:hypothetical protein